MNRSHVILIAMVLAFLAGTFAWSQNRPLDGDEGYYASAARQVSEGQAPYRDFFYPQAPLLPYVYAPWYRMVGDSLAAMRGLSVLVGALSLWLWGSFLRRRWGDRPWLVWTGFLLVALNPYFLSWNVTVKTYALTNLCVFATIWAVDRAREDRSAVWFLLAGLAAVLAAGVRLLYLPWAVVMVAGLVRWAWLEQGNGVKTRHAGAAVGGAVLAGLPVLFFALRSFDLFWFNNVRYHQLRFSSLSAEGSQLVAAVSALVTTTFTNPYFLSVLVLALLGVWWMKANPDHPHRDTILLSVVAADVYAITCLLPDPVYPQYFTGPLTPMAAPAAVAGLAWLADRLKSWRPVAAGAVALMVVFAGVDLGVRRTGIHDDQVWTFEHLEKATEAIETRSEPEDIVLAFWSGYVFESGRQFLPGMENHFALGVSEKLDLELKVRYHVAGKELILQALDRQVPTLVVLGAWMHEINTTIDQRHLPVLLQELDARYELAEVMGETKVMTRR